MALSTGATTAAAGAVSLGVYVGKQAGWFAGWEPMPPEVLSFCTLGIAFLFSRVAARAGPTREATRAAALDEAARLVAASAPDADREAVAARVRALADAAP